MHLLSRTIYTALFVFVTWAGFQGWLWQTLAASLVLVVWDHAYAGAEPRRYPDLLRLMPRARREWLTFAHRHVAVVLALLSSQGERSLIFGYIGVVTVFVLASSKWTTEARRIADAKSPFIVGNSNWPATTYHWVTDHTGNHRLRVGGYLRLSEALILAVALAQARLPATVANWSAVACGLAILTVFLSHAWQLRKMGDWVRDNAIAQIQATLASTGPRILLHFSGGRGSTFQVNMWLGVLEALREKVIVVFRERHHMEAFNQTTVPLVFAETTRDLEQVVPESVCVALYVANVGKNLHWLRNTRCKHVFIGHGDSDKASSAHSVMKVYDHMLVAGQAHIDRMVAAGLHMPDDYYIKVGRPQLELFFDKRAGQ